MKDIIFSETVQWDILECLFSLYPRQITEDSFRQRFGNPDDSVIIAHVCQLIADGLVEPSAVKERVFPAELRLTPLGVNLMRDAPS